MPSHEQRVANAKTNVRRRSAALVQQSRRQHPCQISSNKESEAVSASETDAEPCPGESTLCFAVFPEEASRSPRDDSSRAFGLIQAFPKLSGSRTSESLPLVNKYFGRGQDLRQRSDTGPITVPGCTRRRSTGHPLTAIRVLNQSAIAHYSQCIEIAALRDFGVGKREAAEASGLLTLNQ